MMHTYFATERDAQVIGAIHVQSWKATYRYIVPESYLEALTEENNVWNSAYKEWLSSYKIAAQIAMEGDTRVGVVSYGKSRDEDLENYGEIIAIYILPDYIGLGYGHKLLNNAIQDMARRGYCDVLLWVFCDNYRARRFYEANGFTQDGGEKYMDICNTKIKMIRYIKH